MATATLHLVDRLPPTGETCAAYRSGDRQPAGWQDAGVRARCHRHQDEWRHALTAWHSEMMSGATEATKWAWLLPGSRLHVWQPQIRPLLFALGLHDFFREHPAAEVWSTGCPPEVAEYLTEFSNGAVRTIRSDLSSMPAAQPARGLLFEAAAVLRHVPLVAQAPAPAPDVDLILYSMALSERSVRERGDHYFGRVFDDGPLKVHWLYQHVGSADRDAIENAVSATRRSVTWAHKCVGWGDALAILWTAAGVRRALRSFADRVPMLRIGGVSSSAFARRFVEQLMLNGSLLGELIVFRAMTALLGGAQPSAVCYPYEEKGVEHAIAMAAEPAARCRTIGFAHAAYASGYLYLQAATANAGSQPRPQALATAGRGQAAWLQREFGRNDRVAEVGSPRWTPAPTSLRDHAPRRPLRVLVVTSFAYELEVMAGWIDQMPGLFVGMAVVIRPNPHAWPREQAAALARLRGVAGVAIDGVSSLQAQIADCDVVLFCATSAAAEAMWHGRIAVYVEWSDLWVADPTKGKDGERAVAKCAAPGALRQTLADIAGLDAEGYAGVVATQQEIAAQIYGPFDGERFRDLVMEPIHP